MIALAHINSSMVDVLICYQRCSFRFLNQVQRGETIQLVTWLISDPAKTDSFQVWVYLFLCMGSHGVLDALTNGGHGIAFFAPFRNERYFFPFTPIEVSTLNIRRFFQVQGISVIKSELIWVWLPCSIVCISSLFCVKILKKR